MKYFVISGETSGDQHAAAVIEEIKKIDIDANFIGIGGDLSQKAGLNLLMHQKELAFMGFVEVIQNLGTIQRAFKQVKGYLKANKPDRILLIDYPGFNLRIAKFAKNLGIPVHYYIAPKVWAWNEKRVKKIRSYIDRLYCILPFEPQYFKNHNIEAEYVGNPSWKAIRDFEPDPKFLEKHGIEAPVLALLPGSRTQEISSILPIMYEASRHYPNHTICVAQSAGFNPEFYHNLAPDIKCVKGDMYNLLHYAEFAYVTSGTATLETALMNTPQVVCYQTSALTYSIAKRFIKLPYISLVNIILNRATLKELIQSECRPDRLIEEGIRLFTETEIQERDKYYKKLREILGEQNPSKELAERIVGID